MPVIRIYHLPESETVHALEGMLLKIRCTTVVYEPYVVDFQALVDDARRDPDGTWRVEGVPAELGYTVRQTGPGDYPSTVPWRGPVLQSREEMWALHVAWLTARRLREAGLDVRGGPTES